MLHTVKPPTAFILKVLFFVRSKKVKVVGGNALLK
jgi:hypothetical protein